MSLTWTVTWQSSYSEELSRISTLDMLCFGCSGKNAEFLKGDLDGTIFAYDCRMQLP